MIHKLDAQDITLDFWLNRLLMDKYGTRISGRIIGDKIYIYWWKGNCAKGNCVKLCEAKIKIELILPSKKQIEKLIDKEMGK